MRKASHITILFLFSFALQVNGTILMRNTFESFEGALDWNSNSGGNGIVQKLAEDTVTFQTQRHGGWSLHIYDPNNTSYANAYKNFTNSSSEYMVEFYIWIYQSHAPIDSFPLCVLWDIPPVGAPKMTDLALVIDTVLTPPDEQLYAIHVEDASGFHNNQIYLSSSDIDTWHKIQIHRHPSLITDAVDLYFNGDTVGTYTPMNLNYKSTKISLGTAAPDSLSDGEIYYDDVIVTSPPLGAHPRLLFDDDFVDTLKERMDDDSSTISFSYKDIWTKIDSMVSNVYYPKDTIFGAYGDIIVYPFPQPKSHSDTTTENWNSLANELEFRLNLLSFYYLMEDDTLCMKRVRAMLMSFCNDWQQWTDPDYYTGSGQYCLLDTGFLMWGISLAYDMLYDSLTAYERMNVQNALISLGLNQAYLRALYQTSQPWAWPNANMQMMSGLGIGTLVTDSAGLSAYLDSAESKVTQIVNKSWVCDDSGGWSEGASYAGFGTRYLAAFMQADTALENSLKNTNFVKNYAKWRIYCMLPVESNFVPNVKKPGAVNFCDCHHVSMRWTSSIYRFAALHQDSLAQWYISQRPMVVSWDFLGYFFTFLWFDEDLEDLAPSNLPKWHLFEDIEWAIFRTGWTTNDYVFAMKGDSIKSHTHHDRNSFLFGMGGRWFIGDWGYQNKPQRDSSLLYHNVLVVGSDTLSNRYSKGEISEFYGCSDYGYLLGDASACYDELDTWTREVVFLMDGGHFVVKDWVKAESGQVDTLRWQVNTYIVPSDNDSLNVNYPTATISKNGKHLRMELHKPSTATLNTMVPDSSDTTFKRIYNQIIDTNGIDSVLYLTSYVAFEDGNSCPEVTELPGSSVFATGINYETSTDTANNVVVFSKGGDVVKGLSYVVEVDPSDTIVFNVLADLYYSQEVEVTDTVIDENLDTGTRQDTSLTPTSQGTASLEVSGAGTHRITIFIPGTTESSSDDATSPSSTRRFLYEDSLERYHLLYEDNGTIMHAERFANIDGWVEGYQIGEGEYPSLASYIDTAGNSILGAVWAKEKVLFYSRFTYEAGWSKPCSLVSYSGAHIPHYFPPSLAIDDSGKAHLAWGIVLEGTSEPCTVFSIVRYSTFDAGLDTPSLSDTATLDSVIKPSSSTWSTGYASLDLYNDTISVVVWSRPIGAGKDTIYCKQETASGWPSSPEVVSSSSTKATKPFCDIEGSKVYVVWEEEGVIKHRQRHITGEWRSIETVSNALLVSRNAQILNENICVFTEVPQVQPNHRSHVVYRKRTGEGWGLSTILESTNYESEFAQTIFLGGGVQVGELHFVWTEGNSSPYEIKYKKKANP
jgi:hypothetical protein